MGQLEHGTVVSGGGIGIGNPFPFYYSHFFVVLTFKVRTLLTVTVVLHLGQCTTGYCSAAIDFHEYLHL